jgi:hypothetical protein
MKHLALQLQSSSRAALSERRYSGTRDIEKQKNVANKGGFPRLYGPVDGGRKNKQRERKKTNHQRKGRGLPVSLSPIGRHDCMRRGGGTASFVGTGGCNSRWTPRVVPVDLVFDAAH